MSGIIFLSSLYNNTHNFSSVQWQLVKLLVTANILYKFIVCIMHLILFQKKLCQHVLGCKVFPIKLHWIELRKEKMLHEDISALIFHQINLITCTVLYKQGSLFYFSFSCMHTQTHTAAMGFQCWLQPTVYSVSAYRNSLLCRGFIVWSKRL